MIVCDYCQRPARYFASSAHLYNGNDFGPVWCCPGACDAYVGCHPDGSPRGTLANRERRIARKRAHAAFDPLWQDWRSTYPWARRPADYIVRLMRTRAYEWLAAQMDLPLDQVHIAMFDEARCEQVVQIIQAQKPTAASVRAWTDVPRRAVAR